MRPRRLLVRAPWLVLVALFVSWQCAGISVVETGVGARECALGEAAVGLAEDDTCLLHNAAGLAWNRKTVLSSTCAAGLDSMLGDLTLLHNGMGAELLYFDFGHIPQVDEEGSIVGSFSYREYLVTVGGGITAADLAPLATLPLAECWALGVTLKVLKVQNLGNDALGFSIDIPFMLRVDSPTFGRPYVESFVFGASISNAVSIPIAYEGGHKEDWVPEFSVGASVELPRRILLSLELTSQERISMGLEWTASSILAVRVGLKNIGVWVPAFGVGVAARGITADLSADLHPYLRPQLRGSVSLQW